MPKRSQEEESEDTKHSSVIQAGIKNAADSEGGGGSNSAWEDFGVFRG